MLMSNLMDFGWLLDQFRRLRAPIRPPFGLLWPSFFHVFFRSDFLSTILFTVRQLRCCCYGGSHEDPGKPLARLDSGKLGREFNTPGVME